MKRMILKYCICTLLFTIIYMCFGTMCGSDWPAHAKGWLAVLNGDRALGYRDVFFVFVGIFSFFQNSKVLAFASLCFCAALATSYRFYIAESSIIEYGKNKGFDNYNSKKFATLLAFTLLFIYAIPFPNFLVNGYFFSGGFPTNVWNNSTTIAVFPFAILLFNVSYKQLTSDFSIKSTLIITTLILINISIKPSFFLVFAVVYPLVNFIDFGFKKEFWKRILPLFVGALFLFVYYLYIYGSNKGANASSVAIEPFAYYREVGLIWELPITFIFAYLFPLSYCICVKGSFKDKEIKYSLSCVFVAIIIYLLFIEIGPRRLHGNFQWQLVITSWILFYVCAKNLYVDILTEGFNKKNVILSSIYIVHVIFGILYMVKYFVTGEPY